MTSLLRFQRPHSLVPSRPTVSDPNKMTRTHASFDRPTTERIVRACKALGHTPSALFDAAVCLATFTRNPVKPSEQDTAHFTFDPVVYVQFI